ncbi:MAG TPA: hypothetical protein VHJ38_02850 [Nitrososphaeraceae archaeon]|nr:hypothetical protein [Nitrososphaeraceae archaeon]
MISAKVINYIEGHMTSGRTTGTLKNRIDGFRIRNRGPPPQYITKKNYQN